jgi:hypothetical protein
MKIIGRDVKLGEGVTLVLCLKKGGEAQSLPYRMIAFYRPGELLKWGPVKGPIEEVDSRVDDQLQLPNFIRSEVDFLDFVALHASMLGLRVEKAQEIYPMGPAYHLVKP